MAFHYPEEGREAGGGAAGVPMFDVGQLRKRGAPAAARPRPQYVPVDDGFVTTAGKADRGAKYGNLTGASIAALTVPPPPLVPPPGAQGFVSP